MAKIIGRPADYGRSVVRRLKVQRFILLVSKYALYVSMAVAVVASLWAVLARTFNGSAAVREFTSDVWACALITEAVVALIVDACGCAQNAGIWWFILPLCVHFVAGNRDMHKGWIIALSLLSGIGECIVCAIVLRMIRPALEETASDIKLYGSGIEGERSTADALSTLSDEYVVIHGLPFDRGDVDHIVLGPTGVFVIDTKNMRGRVRAHDGELTINDDPPERDVLSQIESECSEVASCLEGRPPAACEQLLVFPRADVVDTNANGTHIMSLAQLVPYITGRERVLSTEGVAMNGRALRVLYKKNRAKERRNRDSYLNADSFRLTKVLLIAVFLIVIVAAGRSGDADDD